MKLESTNQWNAELYDGKLSFVTSYGKGVLALLDPEQGETILDLGCGTGDLTNEINRTGAIAVGMDNSLEMLTRARQKYPEITFIQANAITFQTEKKYDAVFSNAALHWMRKADKVAGSIYDALKPGGRFVAEFGGKNNVREIVKGIVEVLKEEDIYDAEERSPWYYPSIGEYSQLLERLGFQVSYAHHFNRPTILEDGEQGLNHWLESFSDDFFPEFSKSERSDLYERVKDQVRPVLFQEGNWVADYKRLRIVAVK